MTSLQQQLKNIGTADLRNATEASRKHKASFLFTSREAADYDLETIFALGHNGIAELITIDKSFAPFEKTLFSETMKSVDRVLQTAEENAKLDKSIETFLKRLSPYFTIKPAAKSLEWLIRRFRIHEFNVEPLLASALPYHDTKTFVKVVSLLRIEDDSPWVFLRPVKESGTPLERSLLVKRMQKDRFFMDFVCNTVTSSPAHFSTLYSFFTAVLMEYVTSCPRLTDDMTTALIPHILSSLAATDIPDLQIAAYAILSQIASKVALSRQALRAITDAMMEGCTEKVSFFCLLTIVHIAQSQHNLERFGKATTKRILKAHSFEEHISKIASKFATDRFMSLIIPRLCTTLTTSKEKAKLINSFVVGGLLSSENIQFLCRCLIDGYMELAAQEESSNKSKSKYIEASRPILFIVSQCYVNELDTVLRDYLQSLENQKDSRLQTLYDFASIALQGTRHEIIREANTTLFLCLNSPSASLRLLAIKQLISSMDKAQTTDQTEEVIENALRNCLLDFDGLLLYALRDVPEKLFKFVPIDRIKNALSALFKEKSAYRKKEAVDVIKFLLNNLAPKYPSEQVFVARFIASYTLFAQSKHVKQAIENADISNNLPVLSGIVKDAKAASKSAKEGKADDELALGFIERQASSLKTAAGDALLHFWLETIKTSDIVNRTSALLILTRAVATMDPHILYRVGSTLLKNCTASMSAKDIEAFYETEAKDLLDEKDGKSKKGFVAELRKAQQIDPAIVTNLTRALVLTLSTNLKPLQKPLFWSGTQGSDVAEAYKKTFRSLFEVLVGGKSIKLFNTTVQNLMSAHLGRDMLGFFLSWWATEGEAPIVRARTLQLTSTYISQQAQQSNNTLDFQHIIPTLLCSLNEQNIVIRSQAVDCLRSLAKSYPDKHVSKMTVIDAKAVYSIENSDIANIKPNDSAAFVSFLFAREQEILEDHGYVLRLLKQFKDGSKQTGVRVLDLMIHHIQSSAILDVRLGLLFLLEVIDDGRKLQGLVPLLETSLKGSFGNKTPRILGLLARCYLPANASLLGSQGDKTLGLFIQLLSAKDDLTGHDESKDWHVSTRKLALQQISPEFFKNANKDAQKSIFNALMDIAANGQQADSITAKRILTEVDVPVEFYEEILVRFIKLIVGVSKHEETQVHRAKRSRKSSDEEANSANAVDFYELTMLLEIIDSTEIPGDDKLVKPLFELLAAMLNAEFLDTTVSLEYINQLIMSALSTILQAAEEQKKFVEESTLRVDTIVQCIRTTANPQTHNQALLLMATIASIYPESVLHNVMAVFTFMGANVLRQDDSYSFQVIRQTLEKILPPLVSSSRDANGTQLAVALQVKPVIKVFVGALFHIPKHRRLPLFTVLVRTLGEDEFLYAIVSLLLERHADGYDKGEESDALAEFCQAISHQFNPETQLKAVVSLLKTVLALPNDKVDDSMMDEDTLFNVNEHSAKELRRYKLVVLKYIDSLLVSRGFLNKVMEFITADETYEQHIQPLYMESVELLLKILSEFNTFRLNYAESEGAKPGIIKIWRGMHNLVYDVLEKVNSLLPIQAFVQVVSHLLQHQDSALRRKALTLFNERVSALRDELSEDEESALVNTIADFITLIERESSVADQEEGAINKQCALLCITSLASISGNIHPQPFVDAVPVIIGSHCLQSTSIQLKVSSLACLSIICQEVGPRVVPHLPKFMPLFVGILSETVNSAEPSALLLAGVIGAIDTTVDMLPHFLSPYLSGLLDGLLSPSVQNVVDDASNGEFSAIKSKAREVLRNMAQKIPPRVFLAPVFKRYSTAVQNGKESLSALFLVVSNVISSMSRETMTSHYKQIFKFFLEAFDLRRLEKDRLGDEAIEELETDVIEVFLNLVMKLNETLFKPLFLKIVDWATMELSENEEGAKSRVYFLYRLVDALLEKLKSIFAPYYGYLVEDVIERLQRYISGDQDPDSLWNYILTSLRKAFLYDSDNLWNARNFEKVLDPVINQLQVFGSNESPDDYLVRMSSYVAPCVGQMAVTVSNDTLWKPMNQKVLLKTREDVPEIRLAALKCLEEFYTRLGEEWLLFLAESISFLAELMEDDDPRVEKLVQQVNSQIELHLGESLDKFFN